MINKEQIEKEIRDAVTKYGNNIMSFGYTDSEGKAQVYINVDPSGTHNWAKVKTIKVSEAGINEKDELHKFAQEVWTKIQDEKHNLNLPKYDTDVNAIEKGITTAASNLDWDFGSNPDYGSYWTSHGKMLSIRDRLQKLSIVDPDRAKAVVNRVFPANKKADGYAMVDAFYKKSKQA